MLAYGVIHFIDSELNAFVKQTVTKNVDKTKASETKLKGKMCCPVCKSGVMRLNYWLKQYSCENCLSKLPVENAKNIWFCENCNALLNSQNGFAPDSLKHICQVCGYENDTTTDTVRGICADCGKILTEPTATLCENCKQIRRENTRNAVIATGVVAVGMVAGVAKALVTNEGDEDNNSLPEGNNADYYYDS